MISIIIPAYNDEKYIARCLQSIVNQSFVDYEVVLVLDGSTDNTKSTSLNFNNKINRLKIIEQDNAGAGKARNNGIEHSIGEYIMFVDADDWLEPDALQILWDIHELTNADYIVANAVIVEDRNGKIIHRYIGHENDSFVRDEDVIIKYLELDYDGSSHSPWGKLFKRDIINKHHIRFPDLRRSQDIVFNNLYAKHISSIYVTSKYVYNFWNTIYSSDLLNDSSNRRNSPKFIEAQKNHLNTMEIVAASLYDVISFHKYELTQEDRLRINNSFLKGVYNNIVANAQRSITFAEYALEKYHLNASFQKAIAAPSNINIVYRLFAYFLRRRLFKVAIYYVLLVEWVNSTIKRYK